MRTPLLLALAGLALPLAACSTSPRAWIEGPKKEEYLAARAERDAAAEREPEMEHAPIVAEKERPAPSVDPIGLDWREAERGVLAEHVQLTKPEQFLKAGEAYFDPTTSWVIFQAVPRGATGDAAEWYHMYVARLIKSPEGAITGIEESIRVSPDGSANTCGWFHPKEPWRVIFGSTLVPPNLENQPGYQRETGRYSWAFPAEMEVCTRVVQPIFDDFRDEPKVTTELDFLPSEYETRPLFERPGGYDAECAYSPDGRHIVFSSVDPASGDADLFVWDSADGEAVPVVTAEGYDGGPFFSPDGTWICYRSDRRGDNLLQLFIAELAFDETGSVSGMKREIQLTDNEHVNWAPFWNPERPYLVYATSEVSHRNYEVFAIDADPRTPMAERRKRRITFAEGFDGLPVFNNDATHMMWTSQRGPKIEGEERPSSQVWVARVIDAAP